MLPFLFGLPGKLNTLLTRLSATRATALDNLDATISSCAPASTAVSNAAYTSARAAKMDQINAPPIASGLAQTIRWIDTSPSACPYWDMPNATTIGNYSIASTTSTAWVDVVNYSGKGVLDYVFETFVSMPAGATASVEIIVDGNTLVSTTSPAPITGGVPVFASLWGDITGVFNQGVGRDVIIPLSVPLNFQSSLQIRHKVSVATTAQANCVYKFRKIG